MKNFAINAITGSGFGRLVLPTMVDEYTTIVIPKMMAKVIKRDMDNEGKTAKVCPLSQVHNDEFFIFQDRIIIMHRLPKVGTKSHDRLIEVCRDRQVIFYNCTHTPDEMFSAKVITGGQLPNYHVGFAIF